MDDLACPRCKTTKYRNPSLKLMVNVCGHALCESCVDLLFLKGSGACPDCNIPLRRSNFHVQLFEDAMVEKEVDIRKRVLRDYNKKEEDFESLAEYNDYLEEIETIIYNLANNVDIINTNKRIEQYKRDNKDQINKSKNKIGREEYELEELLEMEREQEKLRRAELAKEESEAKKKKIREKEALIDELMFSTANAKNIVETFAQNAQKALAAEEEEAAEARATPVSKITQFSTGIQFGRTGQVGFLPVPVDEGPMYVYKSPIILTEGPKPPSNEELETLRYVDYVRAETEQEKAGGFKCNIACMRALQDAFAGLYHVSRLET